VGVRCASWIALAVAACSSGKPRTPEDARRATPPGDAAVVTADAPSAPKPPSGDVQVRVEWANVPPAARSSPGKTACGTARAAAVAPTTTWGIPEVVVIVDGAPSSLGEAHVRLADCALSPRIAIGSTLVLDTAADRPAVVALAQRGQLADLRKLAAPTPREIQLPITGHAVTTSLTAAAIYELTVARGDSAWVVATQAAITDPSGVVLVRDVPPGVHTVRAWLPPRGDQPSRHAVGDVTVVPDDLAELTLQLAP